MSTETDLKTLLAFCLSKVDGMNILKNDKASSGTAVLESEKLSGMLMFVSTPSGEPFYAIVVTLLRSTSDYIAASLGLSDENSDAIFEVMFSDVTSELQKIKDELLDAAEKDECTKMLQEHINRIEKELVDSGEMAPDGTPLMDLLGSKPWN